MLLGLVKCIPFVGTAINAGEAIWALVEGDRKKCLAKTAQTAVSGFLDAALVVSGGASALLTAPFKAGAVQGGKIAVKKGLERLAGQGVTTVAGNVLARAASGYVVDKVAGTGGGSRTNRRDTASRNADQDFIRWRCSQYSTGSGSGGGGPPRKNRRLAGAHEQDEKQEWDEWNQAELCRSNPVIYVEIGAGGRPETFHARYYYRHLREGGRQGAGYSTRMKKFLRGRGWVQDAPGLSPAGTDHIGHLAGDWLSGPRDRTYNFTAMSPWANGAYLDNVEKPIVKFLRERQAAGRGEDAYVDVTVHLTYNDSVAWPRHRATSLKIDMVYFDGNDAVERESEISNK